MIFKLPKSDFNPHEWHTIFALTPKNVGNGEYVWLQKVEARVSPYSRLGLTYEYRKLAPQPPNK